jgi:DNA-directed RNA polymerase subunit K/omega
MTSPIAVLPAAVEAPSPIAGPRPGLPLSPFHIVALTFQRARQLKSGARPRVEPSDHRPTRLALLEVLADTVSWTIAPKPAVPDQ